MDAGAVARLAQHELLANRRREFGQIGDACSSSCNPEFGGSEALGEANAKMMAAAPALYEALSAMVATYCVESSTGPVIEAARSALLLANTGGTENG